jgi:hypothetical protein
MSFAETLTQASKDAAAGTSEVQGVVESVLEKFKAECMKAAGCCQYSASCTYDAKLPDGVTIKALLTANIFYKLLNSELKKLKLASFEVLDYKFYEKAEVQEKVLDDDGKQQYKVKEVASYASTKKSKAGGEPFAMHKFAPKWEAPAVGKGVPKSGAYCLAASSQAALDAPLVRYAQREAVLKKVAGPGAHVKVQISGRWTK